MKPWVVLLIVVVAPLVLASDDIWPTKGATIYVSASFKKLSAPSPVGGTQMSYDMPPCAGLVITKSNPKKASWSTKDPVGGGEKLEGAWLPRIHKSKSECEAQYEKEGEPQVSRSGATFTIKPDSPK